MKSLDGGFEVKNFIYDFFKGNHSMESKIIKYGIISLRKFQVEQAEVISRLFRSSHQRCSLRKGVPRNFAKFTGKHLCLRLFFNKVAGLRHQACNFVKKESLAQVFFCQFCEISKNTFS